MRLVVGLGNPGSRYARNRHNVGFLAVDAIARRYGGSAPFAAASRASSPRARSAAERRLLLKPQTFMNASGEAVLAATSFYKIAPEDIVVIHDEIDLRPGKLRVKRGGGSAGHNGLRSIDALIGPDYWRVRIGVGHPGVKELVQPYVLQNFPAEEIGEWVAPLIDAVAETMPLLLAGDARGVHERGRPPLGAAGARRRGGRTAATLGRWVSAAASSACPMSASRRCSTR